MLVREKGVLSNPDPKAGPSLPSETVEIVNSFYQSDKINCVMSGKKDFVSVKKEAGLSHFQKKFILSNLKEVYCVFKNAYPDKIIGFSKFAELHPKHCVLAGASGTHTVCMCTIHQNVKLIFSGARLLELAVLEGVDLSTYHHCLANIVCSPPLPVCYLGECNSCSSVS